MQVPSDRTSLPGVAVVRAAAFAAYTLPIDRWATPEHLYSATGLALAVYQPASGMEFVLQTS